MNRHVRKVEYLDDLDHGVELLLDLFKGNVVAGHADGHARDIFVLGGAHRQALEVVGFAGEEAGYLGQDTHIILNIQRDPSVLHCIIHALILKTIAWQLYIGWQKRTLKVSYRTSERRP